MAAISYLESLYLLEDSLEVYGISQGWEPEVVLTLMRACKDIEKCEESLLDLGAIPEDGSIMANSPHALSLFIPYHLQRLRILRSIVRNKQVALLLLTLAMVMVSISWIPKLEMVSEELCTISSIAGFLVATLVYLGSVMFSGVIYDLIVTDPRHDKGFLFFSQGLLILSNLLAVVVLGTALVLLFVQAPYSPDTRSPETPLPDPDQV